MRLPEEILESGSKFIWFFFLAEAIEEEVQHLLVELVLEQEGLDLGVGVLNFCLSVLKHLLFKHPQYALKLLNLLLMAHVEVTLLKLLLALQLYDRNHDVEAGYVLRAVLERLLKVAVACIVELHHVSTF